MKAQSFRFGVPGLNKTSAKAVSGLWALLGPVNVVPFLGCLSFLFGNPNHNISPSTKGSAFKGLSRTKVSRTLVEAIP